MDEPIERGTVTPPQRSVAEELFARHLQELEADQEVDIDALVRAHSEHAAELERLHEHWQQLTGVAIALDSAGASFYARLKARWGERVDPGLSLDDDAAPPEEPGSSPARTLTRLEAHTPRESRYRFRDEIARGGMGAILKIWDADLRRTLAMKVMLRRGEKSGSETTPGTGGSAEDERLLGRFLEEAQVTAQLDHPGIVPVHELGLDAEGRVYFTMPLIKGQDLSKILDLAAAGEEGWTQTRMLGVILKVCEALAFAHSKKVIHRDLKPANVMVGRFGEAYVMDWGLARVIGREDSHDLRIRDRDTELSVVVTDRDAARRDGSSSPLVTMDGDIVGTPSYMSPEQARGDLEAMGPASDVYSLGCVLYHLLAGHMPYVPKDSKLNAYAVWGMLQNGPPRPLSELAPGTPEELVAICDKAMAREIEQRYADTVEMAEDLRAYLEGRVVQAHRTGPLIEFKKWVQRNKALAATEAAAFLVVFVGMGYFTWYQADKKAEFEAVNTDLRESQRDLLMSQADIGRLELELEQKIAKTEAAEEAANSEKQTAVELSRELEARRRDLEFAQSEIEDALDGARRQAYVANVTAAALNLRADNFPELLRRLEECPVELRGWEWHHLRLFESASLPSFEPQRAGTLAVAFVPGAPLVARLRSDGGLELLDAETGAVAGLQTSHAEPPRAMAVSPDGGLVATGSPDRSIRFLALAPGRAARPIEGACEDEVGALALTPDGRRVIAGEGYRPVRGLNGVMTFITPERSPIHVFDVESGERLVTLEGHAGPVLDLAVHPDGRRLLSASLDGSAVLWDLETGDRLRTYRGHAGAVNSVAFTPEGGGFVSGGADWLVLLWDVESTERVSALRGHADDVQAVATSPDGRRVASASTDATVRIWDVSTGSEVSTLRGHDGSVSAVAFSADGARLLSGSTVDGLRMWASFATTPITVLREEDHRLTPLSLAYGDRRGGGVPGVWSLGLSDMRLVVDEVAALFPDGERLVVPGRYRKLRNEYGVDVWDLASGTLAFVLRHHAGRVTAVDVSPDGARIATASADQTVKLWDAASGELLATLEDHEAPVECVAFGPGGRRIASGASDGRVLVHHLAAGRVVSSQDRHRGAVTAIAWHPTGEAVASGGDDEAIRTWSPLNGFETGVLYGHKGAVTSLVYGPGGARLFSGSADRTIRVWDPEWGLALLALEDPQSTIDSLHLSADGKRLVSVELGRRPVIRVWDSDLGRASEMRRTREMTREARALVDELCGECETPAEVLAAIRTRDLAPDVRVLAETMARALEEAAAEGR